MGVEDCGNGEWLGLALGLEEMFYNSFNRLICRLDDINMIHTIIYLDLSWGSKFQNRVFILVNFSLIDLI